MEIVTTHVKQNYLLFLKKYIQYIYITSLIISIISVYEKKSQVSVISNLTHNPLYIKFFVLILGHKFLSCRKLHIVLIIDFSCMY